MLASMPKAVACIIVGLAFWLIGVTLCAITDNPWCALLFLVTLRFILETTRP